VAGSRLNTLPWFFVVSVLFVVSRPGFVSRLDPYVTGIYLGSSASIGGSIWSVLQRRSILFFRQAF